MAKDKLGEIYCCGCNGKVKCYLVAGETVYPHRPDLFKLKFWRCFECKNFVGCHKNSQKNAPLGNIPTPELKKARQHIHAILDPQWKAFKRSKTARNRAYEIIGKYLGYKYHTAQIRSLEEARKVYKFVRDELPKLLNK